MADGTGMPPFDETGHDTGERPLKPALMRGWRRRCPNCGAGPMMRGYLKVRDECPVCGVICGPSGPMMARPI